MFKPGYRHLLAGAAPALWLALSAAAPAATPSPGRPAAPQAAPAPQATLTPQATSASQGTSASQAPAASAAAPTGSAAPPAAPAVAAPMTGPQIIQLLDQTIDWYRTLGIQQQAANEPSDLLILYDNRQTANHLLGLAFEIARADAEILAKEPEPKEAGPSASSQSLSQLQNKFSAQSAAIQAELDSDRKQLSKARPQQRSELQAKISELQGELDLNNARKSLLATMSTFASQSDTGGLSMGALKAQIDAMAVIVPASASASSASTGSTASTPAGAGSASAATSAGGTPSSAAATAATGVSGIAAARFGVWDLAANVVRLSEKAGTIDVVDRRTADLQATFARIRAPLIDQLKGFAARGDALAAQADAADSATLNTVRDELDALSAQYKQTSVLLIPLSKVGVLLDQYRRNLGNWHDAVKNQYHDALKTLGVRLGVLAVLLAVVFAAAEIWRHAVMRYIQESRRRYQFLLLRKIALWCLVVVIVGFAFASELGSIVTFAGLITAGIAVAMQSVLVSIVGYFFLIGKYGIRVGDRVQIGDVTGEVIDLGLVRLHLMELAGHGSLGPTGRVVAFANSVVFQTSSGLFKQIHGVDLVWRETTLTLPAGIDYGAAKQKLQAAVTGALKEDSGEIARQSKEIQRARAFDSGDDAVPRVQLSFSAAGADAHIRYPVHMQNAAEIDERVSHALFTAMGELGAASKPAGAA